MRARFCVCVCAPNCALPPCEKYKRKKSGASPWRDTHLEIVISRCHLEAISKQSRKRERVDEEEQRERDGCLFLETSWKRQETPTLKPQPPLSSSTQISTREGLSLDNLPRSESMGPSRAYGRVTRPPPPPPVLFGRLVVCVGYSVRIIYSSTYSNFYVRDVRCRP